MPQMVKCLVSWPFKYRNHLNTQLYCVSVQAITWKQDKITCFSSHEFNSRHKCPIFRGPTSRSRGGHNFCIAGRKSAPNNLGTIVSQKNLEGKKVSFPFCVKTWCQQQISNGIPPSKTQSKIGTFAMSLSTLSRAPNCKKAITQSFFNFILHIFQVK